VAGATHSALGSDIFYGVQYLKSIKIVLVFYVFRLSSLYLDPHNLSALKFHVYCPVICNSVLGGLWWVESDLSR
jgi:hypothetical protein